MKNRLLYIVLSVLTVALLVLPAVQQHTKLFKFKPLHGVTNANTPPYKYLNFNDLRSGEFQKAAEQHLSDNYGFREPLIRGYNQVMWSLFRKTYCQDVVVGKKGWLYGQRAVSDYFRQLAGTSADSDEEMVKKLDGEISRLKKMQDLLDERGTKLFVLVCPSKDIICPEHLPEGKEYVMGDRMRAIEYVPEAFAKNGINYLDMCAWFEQIKDTVSYPLFPKTGTHWSNVASMHVADTLIRYMEWLSGKNMPNIEVGPMYPSEPVRPDNDLEKIMNLVWPIKPNQNYYAKVDIVPDSTAQRLKLISIGDSYFWNLSYTMPMDSLFSSHPYWYYFSTVYFDPDHNNVKQLNLVKEVDSADLIMIILTSNHLYNINQGFLSRLQKALSNPYPEVVEDILHKMEANDDWYQSLKEKAERQGKTLDEVMRDDALYLIKKDPEKYLGKAE